MSATVAALRSTISRPPQVTSPGFETWADATLDDVQALLSAPYSDSPSIEELAAVAQRYPDDEYWWVLLHSY